MSSTVPGSRTAIARSRRRARSWRPRRWEIVAGWSRVTDVGWNLPEVNTTGEMLWSLLTACRLRQHWSQLQTVVFSLDRNHFTSDDNRGFHLLVGCSKGTFWLAREKLLSWLIRPILHLGWVLLSNLVFASDEVYLTVNSELVNRTKNALFLQNNKRKKGSIKSRPTVVRGQRPNAANWSGG